MLFAHYFMHVILNIVECWSIVAHVQEICLQNWREHCMYYYTGKQGCCKLNLAFNIFIRAISELLITIFFAVLMDEE